MEVQTAIAMVIALSQLIEAAIKNNKTEITSEDLMRAKQERGISEQDWAALAPKSQ